MSVTTRVYDDYETAQQAVNEVNSLGLSGVEVSILGNESIRDYYDTNVSGTDTLGSETGGTDTLGSDSLGTGTLGAGGTGALGAGTLGLGGAGLGGDTLGTVPARDTVTGRPDVYDTDANASGTATGAGIGAAIGGGAGLLTGLGLLAIPGVGPLVAAGWFAATAVGAAGGALAGGAVGAIVDLGLSEEDAPVFSEAIRRGNVAVSVRFPESERATVQKALDRISTTSLLDRRARYEAEGWDYNETADDRETRLRDTPPVDPINRTF
ncbi:MAG: hypothetical protein JWS10_1223 [Cypionkella sp.]|uniref:hypothetical protein n=1 Tax=Cypionkella sp. TaxID=2811411 RepID=UPI0026185326|nr:hypothetical protein [Cypionkella sp.]MDB5658608.1 hypothetical protein [Cypionkella sp.]